MFVIFSDFNVKSICLKFIGDKWLQNLFQNIPDEKRGNYLACINKWRHDHVSFYSFPMII